MEMLVHTALHFQTIGTVPWLHIPTYSSATIEAELLCALVAFGAFLSPISANQNLGAAMTDIILSAVVEQFEKNNASTRSLQMWQCFLVIEYLMLWSGSKRMTEIGESNTLHLVTMLRRSGAMARDQHRPIVPSPEDRGQVLETKWRAWAEQETKIRVVHHVFIHNAQVSMTRFTTPLISAAEMTLPLPASESLWSARTAEEWRLAYAALPATPGRPPTMADRVRDALNQIPSRALPDASTDTTSDIFVLYGLWSMVWDCQLLQSWLTTDGNWHNLQETLHVTRSSLLSKVLDSFHGDVNFSPGSPVDQKQTEKAIVLSYLHLAVHAPLRCLPIFAGKDGENEAQMVYFMLQEWSQSREGRKSIWYAGQVFKSARALPQTLMQSFFAVTVYHASLTLWAFAIIAGARQKKAGLLYDNWAITQNRSDKIFRLDGDFSAQFYNFVALGDGVPAVSNSSSGNAMAEILFVLCNPGALMQVGVAILKEQAQFRNNNLSKFVDSLLQLMDDLSKAAKSVGFG
jgi:hypothetical protein